MKAFKYATPAFLLTVLSGAIGCNSLPKLRNDDGVKTNVDRLINTIKVKHRASLGQDGCTTENIVYRRE